MNTLRFVATLPGWLPGYATPNPAAYLTSEARMGLAIALAQQNVLEGTGGPFAAAVFDQHTHQLVSVGVNVVEQCNWSCGHAELVALSLANQALNTFDLGAPHLPGYELVSSCEPCVMCLGATLWSGVKSLLCGARDEDARAIGFDEGPKPADWADQLRRRGIAVTRDVMRDEACKVLQRYKNQGGTIYNPSR